MADDCARKGGFGMCWCNECRPNQEKKLRFFGSPELGDGASWVYMGSDPAEVGRQVIEWCNEWKKEDQVMSDGEKCSIRISWMTDAEVEALPEI